MNAINHAVTALVLKKYSPATPLIPLLISVQLIEIFWVILNITGIEVTIMDPEVHSLANVHLAHMPFSHSVIFTLLWAALGWLLVAKVFRRPQWGLMVFIGICSHIVLDIATHVQDIEIIPFLGWPEIGSGLYGVPVMALVVEIIYSVFCWKLLRGQLLMLISLMVLQLFSLTFYVPQLTGMETLFEEWPQLFAPVIGVHIIFGLVAVGFLYHLEQRKRQQMTEVCP